LVKFEQLNGKLGVPILIKSAEELAVKDAPGQLPFPGLQVEGLDFLLDNLLAFQVASCQAATMA
jgi:hypothetical protein